MMSGEYSTHPHNKHSVGTLNKYTDCYTYVLFLRIQHMQQIQLRRLKSNKFSRATPRNFKHQFPTGRVARPKMLLRLLALTSAVYLIIPATSAQFSNEYGEPYELTYYNEDYYYDDYEEPTTTTTTTTTTPRPQQPRRRRPLRRRWENV